MIKWIFPFLFCLSVHGQIKLSGATLRGGSLSTTVVSSSGGGGGNPIVGSPGAPFLLNVGTNSATAGTTISPLLPISLGAYPHAHIAYVSWFPTNVAPITTITNNLGVVGTLYSNNVFDVSVGNLAATREYIWTNSAMTSCVAVFGGAVSEATIGLVQVTNVCVTNLFDDYRTNYTVATVGNNKASNFMSSAVNTLTISFSTAGAVTTPTAAVGGGESIVAYISIAAAHAMEISTNGPWDGFITNHVTWTDAANGLPLAFDTMTLNGFSLHGYSTTFPNAETPISEGGNWTNGLATGLDWNNINTSNHTAFGSQPLVDSSDDDSTAILKGPWGSNQTAVATVFTTLNNFGVPGNFTNCEVAERLRSGLAAHAATGYECLFSITSNHYIEPVQWNGPFNSFAVMSNNTSFGVVLNGSQVKSTIKNTTIDMFVNNQHVSRVTTNTYAGGSPGIGIFHDHTVSSNTGWGISNAYFIDNN